MTFGALQELDLTAARIGGKVLPGQLPAIAASWRTPEILDTAQAGRVSPRILATTITVPALGGRTLAEEIVVRQQQPGPPDPDLAELAEFQAALDALAAADPAAVELAVRAQLDACSHRLDAWQTSLASRRLAAVRAARPTGLNLGGYGCVEHLRPEITPDSSGYVTGPSLAHAATAGVLRSARLANSVAGIDRLDVDLSSARVAPRPDAAAWRARGHAAHRPARLPPRAGAARGRHPPVHPPAADDVPRPPRARPAAGRAPRVDTAARRRRRAVAARAVPPPDRHLRPAPAGGRPR